MLFESSMTTMMTMTMEQHTTTIPQQVLAAAAVVVAIQFLQWFVKRAKLVQAVNRLPGPGLSEPGTSHFLLGHAYRPLQTRGSIPNKPNSPHGLPIQKEYAARFQKDGIYRLWVFHPHTVPFAIPLVYVTDPTFVSQLLERTRTTTNSNKSNKKNAQQHLIICKEKRALKLADALIGDSIFALPDDSPEWKRQRKLSLGFFSQTILEETVRISTGILQDLFFDKWDKNKNNEHGGAVMGIEMEEWSSRLTMEVLGLVGFGYSFGALLSYNSEEKAVGDHDDDSLYNVYSTLLATMTRRFNAPPWAQYLPNAENRNFSRGSHRLNSVMHDVIQERLKEQIQSEEQNEGKDESSLSQKNTKRRKDLLSRLLLKDEQGERLPYKYIFGNVRGFLFAGHDTTSSVLSYALWCLATNPHAMKRLQTELDELFESIVAPGRDESPTYNQLRNLRYLDAVVKETLRLNAPAPIGRASLEDIPLQSSHDDNNNKTYVIPKGVAIIIQPSLVHTSHAHWKDAEAFCPERFLESSTTANNNNNKSFFPFSMGPRHCVGEQLALAELKNILAHMVRRYDLQPNEHAVTPMLFMQFTIKPHEVLLDITPRFKKVG
jgi:cytochrome P450/NADPH-cytochrome P450 reductase